MTKLCSGQGNSEAAAAAAADDDDTADDATDAATADESNPFMSPFQATQKKTILSRGHEIIISFFIFKIKTARIYVVATR